MTTITTNGRTLTLDSGLVITLVQDPYNDNLPDGTAGWFASGYLSTETPGDEAGPTVRVSWQSLGAENSEDDAEWDSPLSVTHYARGELLQQRHEYTDQYGTFFGRINERGNVDVLHIEDGLAATRLDADVWPVGSNFGARYEHPAGIKLELADAEKLGLHIER